MCPQKLSKLNYRKNFFKKGNKDQSEKYKSKLEIKKVWKQVNSDHKTMG